MDIALAQMMPELGAQKASVTTTLLNQVQLLPTDKDLKGKWWMKEGIAYSSTFGILLLRRNFDGSPWKIAGAQNGDSPTWLNTKRFSDLYGQFLYYMERKLIADATQVPNTTVHALRPDSILVWTPIAPGSMKTAATLGQAVGGGSCLLGQVTSLLGWGSLAPLR